MNENIDDFERELIKYSEINTNWDVSAPVPLTIQRYQQIIKENNSASIFDADYNCPDTANNDSNGNAIENNSDDILYKNEQFVTRVTSGRGRGGRNIYHASNELIRPGLSSDELELIRDLRKVAPLGYGNEITENSVRAHQRAKQLEREMENRKTKSIKLNSSSPRQTINQTSAKAATDSATLKQLPSKSLNNQNDEMLHSEDFSSPSSARSSLAQADSNTGKAAVNEQGSEDGSKPIPISTLLKQCRERHKQKQQMLERKMLEDEEASHRKVQELLWEDRRRSYEKDEAASLHKVDELLYQDSLDNATRKSGKSDDSSHDSRSSTSENLLWRQRTNSPPRYAWKSNRARQLDLSSKQDFPPLS